MTYFAVRRETHGMSGSGTSETSTDVRSAAAFAGNPDIEQTSPNDRV